MRRTIVGTAALTLEPTSRSADSKNTSLIVLFLTMELGGALLIAAELGEVRRGGAAAGGGPKREAEGWW